MPLLEQYIVDNEGNKRVVFVDSEQQNVSEYQQYLNGINAAADKQKFHYDWFRKKLERLLHGR